MAVYPESDPAHGLPFCYYDADPAKPQSQWFVLTFLCERRVNEFPGLWPTSPWSGLGKSVISRFAKVLATGLPHTITVTGLLPTITATATEFWLAILFLEQKKSLQGQIKKRVLLQQSHSYNTPAALIKCVQDQVLETTHHCLLARNMLKTTPGYKWVTLLHKCLKVEVFYGFFVWIFPGCCLLDVGWRSWGGG